MAGFTKRTGIMLAYPADDKRINAISLLEQSNGPAKRKMFHQPKLNGERARIEWFDLHPYFISSYGNEFKFLDKLQIEVRALCASFDSKLKLDGEIYVHRWSREQIDSALRRTKNKSAETVNLEYHIFDFQDYTKYQYERIRILGLLEQEVEKLGLTQIKIVPYGMCDETDWIHHCSEYCADGYEGIILRNPFALYEDKRIPGLLKFKPTETDEYEIVAVNEATTSDTNEPKGMVGSFTVKAKDEPGDNVTFDVGAGKLKHDKRKEYWNNRNNIVGRMLLVKHELLKTTNQVPIAAVTVDIIW